MTTIVALSTPPIKSAIHIIRISGEKAFEIVQKISKEKIIKKGYEIQKVNLFDNNKKIDEVLLNKFISPKSYTGEDLIEINCHGSIYIVTKIINALIKNGCKNAKNGEFTKRAFLNNKISLIQSEAINNLINSTSDLSIELAINGLDNKTNHLLLKIRNNIFKILGQIEVNIDYPEYENTPDINKTEIEKIFQNSIKEIEKIILNSKKIISIKDGINVAIIGKPNVGKSSLLNAILKENKAIVSNIPGTTRDAIESSVIIEGIKFNFIDTAGLRDSNNKIEKLGIIKSEEILKRANLILMVIDNSKKITIEDKNVIGKVTKKNTIIVLNKTDVANVNNIKGIKISAKNNDINLLLNELIEYNRINKINLEDKNLLQSTNSILILENALKNLKNSNEIIKKNINVEISANFLKEAINSFEMILGISNNLSFVDELFSKFCVGK